MLKNICQQLIILISLTLTCLAKVTIGILQITEHPALDQTRQGIIDQLSKDLPDTIILWESAQGNPALASQIAQKFVGQDVKVIVAIGTTAAQAALAVTQKKDVPVVYASVTDPQAAKLRGNITGVSNFVDVETTVDKLREALPTLKTVGMIYNPGEVNSERVIELTKPICEKNDINLITSPVSKTSDVVAATQNLVAKVDAILINTDNTALAAIKNIVNIASAQGKPVLCTDTDTVPLGVFAAFGADQYQQGIQAAEQVKRILNGTNAADIPGEGPLKIQFQINKAMAQTLGISISQTVAQTAQIWE
jgi:putative tryptophan/tyrosine transport system substrate-binding protein